MPTNSKRWNIKKEDLGRLDRFLTQHFPEISRVYLQGLIEEGVVKVNGRSVKKGAVLKENDEVQVESFVHPSERKIKPNPKIPFKVVWKSDDLIVIDKPPGLPTHPNDFEDIDTVANALVAQFPQAISVGQDRLRPGIVHRLDGDTSGLLILALTQESFVHMRKQFDERKVKKTYLAMVLGEVQKAGEVSFPIAHHPKNPRKMIAVKKGSESIRGKSRDAVTMYEPIEKLKGYTLLSVKTLTGRMHQVRIHLSSIGHPLVGDTTYQTPKERLLDQTGLKRHFLHAAHLEFEEPNGKKIRLESSLTQELSGVLKHLQSKK